MEAKFRAISKEWHVPTLLLLPILGTAVLISVAFAASGVRGTDQYWYLADVLTLIEGGDPLSNLYFPRAVLDGTANYFAHSGPSLHLSAMVGKIVGPYNGWLVVNLISHAIIAASSGPLA